MKVWIAQVSTEKGNLYVWPYKNKPTYETVIQQLIDTEGDFEGAFEYYENCTHVEIYEASVL